jgi:hypothetical protein
MTFSSMYDQLDERKNNFVAASALLQFAKDSANAPIS